MEPDPEEQRAIALARQLRAEGLTLAAVGGRLLAVGLRPRSREQWHPQTIARMIASRSEG